MFYNPVTIDTLFTEEGGIRYTTTQKLSFVTGLSNSFFRKIVKQCKKELEDLGEVKHIESVRVNIKGEEVRLVIFGLNEAQVLHVLLYSFTDAVGMCNLRKYFVERYKSFTLPTKSL